MEKNIKKLYKSLSKNKKWCWLATETKNGWRIKFCIGSKDYPLRGMLFSSTKEIYEKVCGNIVFVHLKDND